MATKTKIYPEATGQRRKSLLSRKQICNLYQQEVSVAEISRRAKVHVSWVYRVLGEAGIDTSPKKKKRIRLSGPGRPPLCEKKRKISVLLSERTLELLAQDPDNRGRAIDRIVNQVLGGEEPFPEG